MVKKEFNLSEKICTLEDEEFKILMFKRKDIIKFIKKIKKHFDILDFESKEAYREYIGFINKLAGDKLIEGGNPKL